MEGKWANLQGRTVLTEQVEAWSWSVGTERPCWRGHGLAVWGLSAGAEGLFCWWLVFRRADACSSRGPRFSRFGESNLAGAVCVLSEGRRWVCGRSALKKWSKK